MKNKILLMVIMSLFITMTACNNSNLLTSTFSFIELNDCVFELELEDQEIAFLEGHNIADGDYQIIGEKIIINKDYLVSLNHGQYVFNVYTTDGIERIKVIVDAPLKKYQIINGGFETGDLFGWTVLTVFKGEDSIQAFIDEGIKANETFFSFEVPYNGDGNYVYGLDDRDGMHKDRWNERMGMMRSSVFELGGSGYISFKLGGGKNHDLCFISIRNAHTDIEVARYGNHKFNSTNFQTNPNDFYEANLVLYKADLKAHIGERLYIEIVDYGGRDWDLLTFDSFETVHKEIPSEGELAIDIKPVFNQGFIPNQLPNGNFSQGLNDWTISDAKGWSNPSGEINTFVVLDNSLRSNATGDQARGLIRSSLFKVDGSGIISLEIGAACGARYDKDTFISIREEKTNREVFRLANTNHNGSAFVKYYVDLSMQMGKNLYFEIVDNATGSYDTIFVANINTYYETKPTYNYAQTGRNLNY